MFNYRFGVNQEGIVETILSSVGALHEDFYGPLLENIILTGGTSLLPGLIPRLERELQQETEAYITPKITHIKDVNRVFKNIEKITLSEDFPFTAFNKKFYNEYGFERIATMF